MKSISEKPKVIFATSNDNSLFTQSELQKFKDDSTAQDIKTPKKLEVLIILLIITNLFNQTNITLQFRKN